MTAVQKKIEQHRESQEQYEEEEEERRRLVALEQEIQEREVPKVGAGEGQRGEAGVVQASSHEPAEVRASGSLPAWSRTSSQN